MKKTEKVKRMLIQISFDDPVSKKHFSEAGELTYLELVGETKKGLKALESVSLKGTGLRLEKLQKKDIKKLAKFDRESHLVDKSSRMRKIFMKPDAEKMLIKFYNALLRNKGCIVVKEGNTPAGSIGFFVDKKNKYGLVASIYVGNDFKGRGISKLLYKSLLMEFSKKKLAYYIGSTTTQNVLGSAKTMGRLEFKSAYISKI
ncbi:GNAT family N-acetyltransferase [Bacteriovorax sp. PP10]|uniref:GNAT family N-acetyltransferase n=1 Tax=Bacteriovorax antarcticus TaxID=3088717 RepID=A0ABU5VXF4_9BACT|nr:GNAT family N-acetyltransferase [Bacteriovorax sp. PP10]MEA9357745.1 GNAT family N-acetyltransferase [Bacteriovorax sp. PP10]